MEAKEGDCCFLMVLQYPVAEGSFQHQLFFLVWEDLAEHADLMRVRPYFAQPGSAGGSQGGQTVET